MEFLLLVLGLAVALGQDPCDSSNPPPVLTEVHSIIQTPNAGNGTLYPPNSLCEWQIQAPSLNYRAVLNFNIFELEDCLDCSCDYLEIYNGPDATAPLIGRYCGTHERPVFTGGYVTFVRYVSNAEIAGVGFKAVLTFEDAACGGGVELVDNNGGWITSANYPNDYDVSMLCNWRIRSTNPDMRVALTFNDFSLETGCDATDFIYDYVLFNDNTYSNQIGYWFGDIPASDFRYTSYGNDATIVFKSDYSFTARGFNITFNLVPKDD